MNKRRFLFLYVFPFLLILAFVVLFIHSALWYEPDGDDTYFLGVLKAMGVWKGSLFFYQQVTGRWLGHILSFLTFSVFQEHVRYYWILISLLMLFFVFSLGVFIRAWSERYYRFIPDFAQTAMASFLISACLFFLVYEGRWETWYWLSSVWIHPFGLSLLLLGLSPMLWKEQAGLGAYSLIIVCFLSLGGIQEICSVLAFLFFAGIYYTCPPENKKALRLKIIPAAIALSLSFGANLLSSGFRVRVDNQPPFRILQSLRNTVHSVLVPLLDYTCLLPRALAFAVFVLWLQQVRTKLNREPGSGAYQMFWKKTGAMAFLIFLALFMTCYVLCDIAPQRCLIFPGLIFIIWLGDVLLRNWKDKSV
jgi:hypothetical protein